MMPRALQERSEAEKKKLTLERASEYLVTMADDLRCPAQNDMDATTNLQFKGRMTPHRGAGRA
jgi:hypothetical protein